MDFMLKGFTLDVTLQGLLIGIAVATTGLIIAAARKGAAAMKSRPRRMQSFATAGEPRQALKAVIRFAQQAGYKVAALDEASCRLVLEESASLTSWGFFLPVFISARPDGSALVEVGIRSKLVQAGPITSRSHERCVTGMKAALLAAS